MKKLLLLIFASFAFATISSAQKGRVYIAQDFSSISYSLPVDLIVSIGSKFEVKAVGTADDIDKINIEKDGRTLNIRTKVGRYRFDSDTKVYVTLPVLNSLSLAGSGDVEVKGTDKADDLRISLAGSGNIKIERIEATKFSVAISGSGSVTVQNDSKVSSSDYKIAGSGDLNMNKVKAADVEINIAGSGNVNAFASENLKVKIAGSGNVDCIGNPKNVDKMKFGSGNINVR